MGQLQFKRGLASAIDTAAKAAGEPFVKTNLSGQLILGVDGTSAQSVIADVTGDVANLTALYALVDTKQGDVYVTLDDKRVYKRVSMGTGVLATGTADWQRIGLAADGVGVIHFGALAIDVDSGVDDIAGDINTTDWTGHPHVDPENPQNLIIYANEIVNFYNGTEQAWNWLGPKPVSIGTGGAAPTTPDSITGQIPVLHTVIPADLELTGTAFDDIYTGIVDEAAMIALTGAKQGDIALRTDNGNTYKLRTQDPSDPLNWEILAGSGATSFPAVGAGTNPNDGVTLPDPSNPVNGIEDGDIGGPLSDGTTYIVSGGVWVPLGADVVYDNVGDNASNLPVDANQGDVLVDDLTGIVYKHNGGTVGDITDWTIIGSNSGTTSHAPIGSGTPLDPATELPPANVAPVKAGDFGGPLSDGSMYVSDGTNWIQVGADEIIPVADAASLPVYPDAKQGDVAIAADTGTVYKMDAAGVWQPIGSGSDETTAGVADEAAMVALAGAKQGDVITRLDNGNTYKLSTPLSTVAGDWIKIAGGGTKTHPAAVVADLPLITGMEAGDLAGPLTNGSTYIYDGATSTWVPAGADV
ncbi:MAG: hypothetical protein DRQ40_05750, partial [Gammaproteobacteria bacterium]